MASLLDMNREEREEYVIRLYKEGRTVRQIAELVHMSFRDIGAITNKVKLQADRERGYIAEETKSPESQAFKMFAWTLQLTVYGQCTENEKWKSTNQILKLNRMIDEFQSSLEQKRGEMAYMNQESRWDNNRGNLYPIPYSEPDISSYSIRLSYAAMNDYWADNYWR